MAILRAGPFASSTDSFLDEPLPLTTSIYPVNCAMDISSSNWPWKYLFQDNDSDLFIISGLPSDSQTNGSNDLAEGNSLSEWKYQAAQTTSFSVTYAVETPEGFGFSDRVSFAVNVNGVVELSDSSTTPNDAGIISISGTATINLPISVIPALVRIAASFISAGSVDEQGSLEYSVS